MLLDRIRKASIKSSKMTQVNPTDQLMEKLEDLQRQPRIMATTAQLEKVGVHYINF